MTNDATEQDIEKACMAKIDHLTYKHVNLFGKIVAKIAKVRKGPSDTRRVRIDFEPNEHCMDPDGKPLHYLPCKGMIRVLVEAWGKNGSVDWIGKSVELFGNPEVIYGGKKKGGIQISRLSHIEKPLDTQLTISQGNTIPFRVEPLILDPRITKFRGWLKKHQISEREVSEVIGGRSLEQASEEDWAVLKEWATKKPEGTE